MVRPLLSPHFSVINPLFHTLQVSQGAERSSHESQGRLQNSFSRLPSDGITAQFNQAECKDTRSTVLNLRNFANRRRRSTEQNLDSPPRSHSLESVPVPRGYDSWRTYLGVNGTSPSLGQKVKLAGIAVIQHLRHRINNVQTASQVLNSWGDSVMHVEQLSRIANDILRTSNHRDTASSGYRNGRKNILARCLHISSELERIALEKLTQIHENMPSDGRVSEHAT